MSSKLQTVAVLPPAHRLASRVPEADARQRARRLPSDDSLPGAQPYPPLETSHSPLETLHSPLESPNPPLGTLDPPLGISQLEFREDRNSIREVRNKHSTRNGRAGV